MIMKADKAKTDRRGFLKFASLGTVAGGAALATGRKADASESPDEKVRTGYRESEHVKAFYKSARF